MIVLLNPVLNCSKSLSSFSVDNNWNVKFCVCYLKFAPLGASVLSLACTRGSALGLVFLAACVVISVKTQFSDQVKTRDTPQLIKGMSKVFPKLLKCFNETTISRFHNFLAQCFHRFLDLHFMFFPVMLLLYFKDSKFVMEIA